MTDAAFRDGIQAVVAELRLMRATLERFLPDEEPPEEGPAPGCQHPEDRRIDFGVTDGQPDWQCGDCGFRSIPQGAPV